MLWFIMQAKKLSNKKDNIPFWFGLIHSCVTFPSEVSGSVRTPWGTRAHALETAAERSFSGCTGNGAAAPGEV